MCTLHYSVFVFIKFGPFLLVRKIFHLKKSVRNIFRRNIKKVSEICSAVRQILLMYIYLLGSDISTIFSNKSIVLRFLTNSSSTKFLKEWTFNILGSPLRCSNFLVTYTKGSITPLLEILTLFIVKIKSSNDMFLYELF